MREQLPLKAETLRVDEQVNKQTTSEPDRRRPENKSHWNGVKLHNTKKNASKLIGNFSTTVMIVQGGGGGLSNNINLHADRLYGD